MNRDKLLTKLAMELDEWPLNTEGELPSGWVFRGPYVGVWGESSADSLFPERQWLQRRAELINKPSWDDAPEWAQWLAQDESAKDWWWYEDKPKCGANGEWNPCTMSKRDRAGLGFIPNGHDWRETLERRPDFNESRADAIGQNGPTGDHYMTPEEEEIPAQEKIDCERCGGCYYSPPHDECPCLSGKQERYRDQDGDDWIDEFARTSTVEEFRGAMRFSIGKYLRRMGEKDERIKEIRKISDYANRWADYEEQLAGR